MTASQRPPEEAPVRREPASPSGNGEGRNERPGFARDFLTGCLALVAVAVIGLVLVPLVIMVFKVSAFLVVPLGLLAIFVILTAFLGRIINMLRARWPQKKK